MQLNLLEKTELRINLVEMNNVNLTEVAAVTAQVLSLPVDQVLVVDVREDHICLDILAKTISMEQIIGKEPLLLEKLRTVQGLTITAATHINSSGIMGLIGCDTAKAESIVATTEQMGAEIEQAVLGRALVYSTGFEVSKQMIKDTNSPYLIQLLQDQGYKAEFGGVIEDSQWTISRKLLEAADRGIGLVITTGGVGAEDKDFSVEALLAVDPAAATPWLVKFEKGTGRHVKEGVRIGVGQVGLTTFISLPGPHDEVVVVGTVLQLFCQKRGIDKQDLANAIAEVLREKLRGKLQACHHQGGHFHG